ncbi:MAG: hypothetical protein LBV41_12885 [Cytophagaceae bacterium]|jgi:hypothetical protein|nr:hypothetical protein [Cytophagaceae bacterium]
MKIDKNTTFGEFLYISSLFGASAKTIENIYDALKDYKPAKIAGKPVPKDFNRLTWADLTLLQSCKTEDELLYTSFKTVINVSKKELLMCPAIDVLAFILFARHELARIVKMFSRIQHRPSAEERHAGIEQLNFGLFGTLDWWAKRMGIADHEEAEKTPWIRIYTCMKNDNLTEIFQKRLNEVILKKRR